MKVYEDDDFIVYHREKGAECVYICFSPISHKPDRGVWLGNVIDASLISITQKSPNWYSDFLFGKALSEIRVLISRYDYIYVLGASAGGYAAIRYSGELSADRVIAFSPQISIKPDDVSSFDRRFEQFYDGRLHDEMIIKEVGCREGNLIIVYDPLCMEDHMHVGLIRRLSEPNIFGVKFSGHASIVVLYQIGLLRGFIYRVAKASDIDDALLWWDEVYLCSFYKSKVAMKTVIGRLHGLSKVLFGAIYRVSRALRLERALRLIGLHVLAKVVK